MPVELKDVGTVVGIIAGLLAILGTVFGWFAKAGRWVASHLYRKGALLQMVLQHLKKSESL